MTKRSRDAAAHPSYATPRSRKHEGGARSETGGGAWLDLRYGRFAKPVTRIEQSEIQEKSSPSGSLPGFRCAQPGLRRKKKNIGGETPTDAIGVLPRRTGPAAPGSPGAHLSAFHRGSRPKESFIARDSAPGFCFLGRGLSVEWALPTPAYPSPARPSRPGHSAEGLMPNGARERVASPPAGHRTRPVLTACRPQPVRLGEVPGICNVIGDARQAFVTITVT
jgi:hypothetical protein